MKSLLLIMCLLAFVSGCQEAHQGYGHRASEVKR